ncbi:MAG: 50S ribosomal protein L4 [candidate division WOR-3 bacterium]
MAIKAPLYNYKGEKIGEIDLREDIFGYTPNVHLLWEYVRMYLANQRQGTACTKTRGEVSGGGRKPWPQKHTGRARHGSIRSPIWRKGGVVFGPKPRDYHYQMPKKAKRLATKHALSDRAKENKIIVIENFSFSNGKTKEGIELLKKIGIYGKKVLIAPDKMSSEIVLPLRNIEKVRIMPGKDLNAYEVLNCEYVLFTKDGLNQYIEFQGSKK